MANGVKSFHDVVVWQKAMELVTVPKSFSSLCRTAAPGCPGTENAAGGDTRPTPLFIIYG
jgi:hypothetical protein